MGFLSRMVNDMVKESTGYDVRKVTRLVGGKNLLMLGAGAALAGGVAGAFQQQQGGAGQAAGIDSWDAPRGPGAPPPSPPPSAPPSASPSAPPATAPPSTAPSNAPPTLPPVPAGPPGAPPPVPTAAAPTEEPAVDEPELPPELTFAIVRSMVAAALADGHLDEKEKQMVLDRLEESDLSMEQKQQVHRDLVLPPTPAELAAMTDEPAHRQAMYRLAGLLVLADGDVSDLERSFLDRLASALGFDTEQRAALESEIFA